MNSVVPERGPLMHRRAAVFALFVSFGMVIATWAVHLPSLKQATGISTSSLGTVLLILGIGALVGMQLSGRLIDRFGSESVAVFGGCAVVIAVVAPLAATTFSEAALGAFLLGVVTGNADVAMNAAAASASERSKSLTESRHRDVMKSCGRRSVEVPAIGRRAWI
jgi:predicted MFS family arabinose efflux permease